MFGGYETIEAYEDELYREESSSELSVDSEVEFQLYSQIHYAQDLDDVIREEEHEVHPRCSSSMGSRLDWSGVRLNWEIIVILGGKVR